MATSYWVVTRGWVTGIFPRHDKALKQVLNYEGGGEIREFSNMEDAWSCIQSDQPQTPAVHTPYKRKGAPDLYDRLQRCREETLLVTPFKKKQKNVHSPFGAHTTPIKSSQSKLSKADYNPEDVVPIRIEPAQATVTVQVLETDSFLSWFVEQRTRELKIPAVQQKTIKVSADPSTGMMVISSPEDMAVYVEEKICAFDEDQFWVRVVERTLLLCPRASRIQINCDDVVSLFGGEWMRHLADPSHPLPFQSSDCLRMTSYVGARSVVWCKAL